MKTFILEGADVDQKNGAGMPIMRGWRHYKIMHNGEIYCPIMPAKSATAAAAEYGAKFFPRGTWEDTSREVEPGFFPTMKAEIEREIFNSEISGGTSAALNG